jgi:N-acetylglucosaminyldiphosphoundecaprenol N-acetyl-beta-D-mannosaminyltransferase
MQRTGLTWTYRLYKEPLRLGPRYLRYNSMFVSYLLWDILRRADLNP